MGKTKKVNIYEDDIIGGSILGGAYICGPNQPKRPKHTLKYISQPRSGDDSWKVEDKFRNWGKPPKKTGDKFADWAINYKWEYEEARLEDELRELFIKELHEQKE